MKVKTGLPSLERIRKILKDQNGVIITSDLAGFEIPRTYLAILEKNGEIERVSRGVYKTPSAMEDEMFIFQTKYKSSIYSHETALFLHDLTDRNPLKYSVTVPSGYHSAALNGSDHKVFYAARKLFGLGVVVMPSPHGNGIRVTNLERTICDILRNRNQIDVQYVNNALKRYVTRKDRNINLLYEYARKFGVQKIVRQYIEILL
jgi:predicted transcriptional regulator of viral defense system